MRGPPAQVRDLVEYVTRHRADRAGEPFEIVVGGRSEPATAAGLLGPLQEAGATWWDERLPQ